MIGRFTQGQPTVFGMLLTPRIRWRHHEVDRRLYAQWQEAARAAREPIIHTATDENCPTHVVVAHGYGVPEAHERQCECMDCALARGVKGDANAI